MFLVAILFSGVMSQELINFYWFWVGGKFLILYISVSLNDARVDLYIEGSK